MAHIQNIFKISGDENENDYVLDKKHNNIKEVFDFVDNLITEHDKKN